MDNFIEHITLNNNNQQGFVSLPMGCKNKRKEKDSKVFEWINWTDELVISRSGKGYGWSCFQDGEQEFNFGHSELEISIRWPTGNGGESYIEK